jgi:hypothetical protein
MATISEIVLKTNGNFGVAPTIADLVIGEVAFNYADGIMYYKTIDNTIDYFGTVQSVNIDPSTTGLSITGGPITRTGTFTLGGVLAVEHGGTGAGSSNEALTNLLPDQTDKGGYLLSTNGSTVSWTQPYSLPIASGSVLGGIKVGNHLSIDETTGVLDATYTYTLPIASTTVLGGVKVGNNLSIDPITGVLDATFTYTLPTASATVLGGIKVGNNLSINPVTGVLDATAAPLQPATADTLGGIKVGSGLQITPDGTLSSNAVQTVTLTGDVTGTGTSTIATTLATVNSNPGTFGDAHQIPTITINSKGLVTNVSTQHVDTSVRDLVDETETLVIAARHQYIVTSRLEVVGRIENNGRIAIL